MFGKVLCKSKRDDITKKIILLMKTWRLYAREGFSIIKPLLSLLMLSQVGVGYKVTACGLVFLLASPNGVQEWVTLNVHPTLLVLLDRAAWI